MLCLIIAIICLISQLSSDIKFSRFKEHATVTTATVTSVYRKTHYTYSKRHKYFKDSVIEYTYVIDDTEYNANVEFKGLFQPNVETINVYYDPDDVNYVVPGLQAYELYCWALGLTGFGALCLFFPISDVEIKRANGAYDYYQED